MPLITDLSSPRPFSFHATLTSTAWTYGSLLSLQPQMNTPQANTGSMASTSNESASASFLFSDDDEDENNKVAGSVGAEDVPDSSGEQDMHDMMDVDMPGVGNLLQGHVQGPFHRPLRQSPLRSNSKHVEPD